MPRRPLALTLPAGEVLAALAETFGDAEEGDLLEGFAQALTAGPAWERIETAVLVVRTAPAPLLGFLGAFDEAEEARLRALQGQLRHTLRRLRYVCYAQAERDAEQLAQRLTRRFGREAVRRFRFAAIPRGGHLALGMLAYALGLDHAQLTPPHPPETPLVVVDDCAISGARFGHFLSDLGERPVVFAPLYAHPDLRAAVEEEPQVLACLSARDLRDHAPERLGDDYPDWKARWRERAPGGYWTGQPDHVVFPWNEPDIGVWNPVAEQVEHGWRVAPPAYCLKNRLTNTNRAGPEAPPRVQVHVQVQPRASGLLRPADAVLFGMLEGDVLVADAEAGACFRLAGVAGAMWQALLAHPTRNEALAALLQTYDVDEATLRADLFAFADDLLTRGLLVRNAAPAPS